MTAGTIIFIPTGSIGRENMLGYWILPDVVTFGGSWKLVKTAIANGEWEALGSYAEH